MNNRLPIVRQSADTLLFFDPDTGEELQLSSAATDRIAALRYRIREAEEDLRQAKKLLDAEIHDRMDREARWSYQGGGYKVASTSPAPSTEYDPPALRAALEELADEGLISQSALTAAVEASITYKVKAAGVNALRKLGGRVAEVIEEHSEKVQKERRVRVEKV